MEGYIFDLDGVLTDTARFHYQAWKVLADELGIPFTLSDNEKLKGISRRDSLEYLLKLGDVQLPEEEILKLMTQKNALYLRLIETLTADDLLPGVKRYLELLQSAGKLIILGSASKNAVPILEKLNVLGYFHVVVDGTHVEKAKPDPQVFLLGAERAGLKPNQCLVFEDSEAGICAAKAAGMLAVGVGTAEELSGADIRITTFETEAALALIR